MTRWLLTFDGHDLAGVHPFGVLPEPRADLAEITRMLLVAGVPIHVGGRVVSTGAMFSGI